MTTKNPFKPGVPVNIVEIAAHVAHERGLGAGGEEGLVTLMRVAELTTIVQRTNQVVRSTPEGLVDVVTGILVDDIADARRRFATYAPALEKICSDRAVVNSVRLLRSQGIQL